MTGLAGDYGVAKDKKQAIGKKSKKAQSPAAKAGPSRSPARKANKTAEKSVKKAVRGATARAKELAANPAVAEIVAASLVAAAAAIKNPQKARDMASAIGDQLETASKQSVDRGNAFWQLAIDIARRSIEALGPDQGKATKSKSGTKKKAKK
jgi:hypothetical protein